MAPYTKPYQSIPDMLSTLEQRGMAIADKSRAAACLERIGYYRLSGYWYPLRKSEIVDGPDGSKRRVILDEFRDGANFGLVHQLYVFDKKLRLLLLDAIERVEIALRVAIAIYMGAKDSEAHLDANLLDGHFTKNKKPNGKTGHQEWIEKYRSHVARSKEEFVNHFSSKYAGSEIPIWIAIEVWDFGTLSFFFSGLKYGDKRYIANKFNIKDPNLLGSWIRAINGVRNACAHHSRVWNNPLVETPKIPKIDEHADLQHLIGDRPAQTRIYAVAVALQYLLSSINPGSQWGDRLKELCETFPTSDNLNVSQGGFPENWGNEPLWNKAADSSASCPQD